MKCAICKKVIEFEKTGEPYLKFKGVDICSICYIEIIKPIYLMSGYGDGGVIKLIFNSCSGKKDLNLEKINWPAHKPKMVTLT